MNKNIIYVAIALATSVSYIVEAKEARTSESLGVESKFLNNQVDFTTQQGIYGGIGWGISFGRVSAYTTVKTDDATYDIKDKRLGIHRLMGTAVLGGGKTFKEKHNLSAELMFDFSKSTSYYGRADDGFQNASKHAGAYGYTELKLRNNGVVPTLALRYGYVSSPTLMFYTKLGASYHKVMGEWEATDPNPKNSRKVKISRVTPIIGGGIEKAFGKFITRLDVDYKFHRQKSTKCTRDNEASATHSKVKDDGMFNVRFLVCYNINI